MVLKSYSELNVFFFLQYLSYLLYRLTSSIWMKSDSVKDIDRAILYALLKGENLLSSFVNIFGVRKKEFEIIKGNNSYLQFSCLKCTSV